ncbi:glycosyltransferase [Clostridium paraputrificum]|uniref:glycosyltransferase n=1 Tax=Clostridium paraputrificum TaxID=29363 RepID=UPI00041DEB95|nr:glycosyltransferase [Clostridium paraputrificum]
MNPTIVAVGYNRPDILKRLLHSIENAKYNTNNVNLIISIDKASNEMEVVKVAEEFIWSHGKKIIRRFPERQGLRKHILQCGDLTEKYGAVIILEDDLIVSTNFYEYTIAALNYYENEKCITGISLYSHEWNGYARKNFVTVADQFDTYLGQFSITWGQCWTDKWWRQFKQWYKDHEDKLEENYKIPSNINRWSDKSWGKYFVNYIVETNKFYVIPRVSYSTNCSDVGEHVRVADNVHQVRLMTGNVESYYFAPVNQAQKYDIFFENLKLENQFEKKICDEGIVIDLAGYGRKQNGKRYLLTTLELPYKILKSYGLQLRPYEMNIMYDIPGENIFLYDTKRAERKRNKKKNLIHVIRYEVRGFSVRDFIPYITFLVKQSLKIKFSKKGKI